MAIGRALVVLARHFALRHQGAMGVKQHDFRAGFAGVNDGYPTGRL